MFGLLNGWNKDLGAPPFERFYLGGSGLSGFSLDGREIIAQASTLDKELKLKSGSNSDAAEKVGTSIAEKCLSKGIKKVAFDRSGYKYHGRVKALAEAARSAGLEF